jgi:O-antigen ligase
MGPEQVLHLKHHHVVLSKTSHGPILAKKNLGPRFLLFAFAVASYTIFILKATQAPLKWQVALLGFVALPLVGFSVSHLRRFLLSLLALSLPFASLDISFFNNPNIPGDFRINISLTDILVAALLIYGLVQLFFNWGKRPSLPKKVILPMSALLILGALSILNAPNRLLGGVEWFRLLKMFLLFWVVMNSIRSQQDLKFVVIFLVIGIIGESLIGIYQHFQGGSLGLSILGEKQEMMAFASLSRVGGTLGHPNRLAMYLGMVLPLTLAAILFAKNRRHKVTGTTAFILGAATLVLTLSRAGWAGFVLSSIVVLFFFIKKSPNKSQIFKVAFVVLLLSTILVFSFSDTITTRLTQDDEGSAQSRITVAQLALEVIKDYPILGGGIGNYLYYLPVSVTAYESFAEAAKVHNLYLLLGAEMGIPALLVYLLLYLVILSVALKNAFRAQGIFAVIFVGSAAGLMSFALHSLVDYVEIGRWPTVWLFFALIFAAERLRGVGYRV